MNAGSTSVDQGGGEQAARSATAEQTGSGRAGAGQKRGGGPSSERGRLKARLNALNHSLRSEVVFSDDMQSAIADLQRILTAQFPPVTEYECTLIYEMAVAKAKGNHCGKLLEGDNDRCIARHLDFWDHDQTQRALDLRAKLLRDPTRTVHALRGFKQGAEVMISDWDGLRAMAAAGADWGEDQRDLAWSLLGVAPILRLGSKRVPPAGDPAALVALAEREIAALRTLKADRLDGQDEQDQADAVIGLTAQLDHTTKLRQRYATTFRNDYERNFKELLRVRAEAAESDRARQSRSGGSPPSSAPANRNEAIVRETMDRSVELYRQGNHAGALALLSKVWAPDPAEMKAFLEKNVELEARIKELQAKADAMPEPRFKWSAAPEPPHAGPSGGTAA
jgi:hypothetical protein